MFEDVALAAFLTVIAQIELRDAHQAGLIGQPADMVGPYAFDVAFVAATTLALSLRRRWPAAVPAAVYGGHVLANLALAHALPFFGAFSALMVLSYTVGRWSIGATARFGWVGPVAWAATFWIHVPASQDPWSLAFQLGMLVTPWAAGWTIKRLQDQRTALDAALAGVAEAEQARRRSALLAERTRIAREMHDVVAHGVSVMVIQAGSARLELAPDDDAARQSLLAVERTGRQVLGEMRRTVSLLREDDRGEGVAPTPGLADLPELVAVMTEAGMAVELDLPDLGDVGRSLDPGRELTVYRIVQEALTNTLRHAGPTRARVEVRGGPALTVRVCDDGPQHKAARRRPAGGGNGLVGMRERVAMYGGVLAAVADGRGFAVCAEIPWEDPR
jgi:signal transduction histidine kinase